ncbi:MAG TPA: FAD-dependent oxidoreductase [Acidimicrobiales bacterium]|nr:FAD-dependent oxidoreductase [Acidimicrobiales bacterium]
MRTEVVIVGAGYAGLRTATRLRERGHDVVVLEARDRVGGRVRTDRSTGTALDLGGMWVGAEHDRFRTLLGDTGTATYPTPEHGRSGWWDGDRGELRRARLVPGPWSALPGAALALARLDRAARRVPVGAPWDAPAAERLDAVTAEAWLRWIPGRAARDLVRASLVTSLSVELSEVSMLTLLASIADAGGTLKLLGTEGAAQQDLVVGGADGPARHLAEQLGERLRLDAPVARISWHDGSPATVSIDGGGEVVADAVVVAVPPPNVLGIRFDPALPGRRQQLLQRMPMGSVVKLLAVYDRPFWRDAGWSGDVVDARGPVPLAFDATPPGGPAVLATLVCGRRGRELGRLDPDARREVILDAFARWFGPAAASPRDVAQVCWDDEAWSGGAYSAIPTPGTTSTLLAGVADPVGPIHWAGTETADRWGGFIEGAIRSGDRAADEVAARLRSAG